MTLFHTILILFFLLGRLRPFGSLRESTETTDVPGKGESGGRAQQVGEQI